MNYLYQLIICLTVMVIADPGAPCEEQTFIPQQDTMYMYFDNSQAARGTLQQAYENIGIRNTQTGQIIDCAELDSIPQE